MSRSVGRIRDLIVDDERRFGIVEERDADTHPEGLKCRQQPVQREAADAPFTSRLTSL